MSTGSPPAPLLGEGDLELSDGRRLGYAEYGDPTGHPFLFFPGTPGSRYFHVPEEATGTDDDALAGHGVRLVVLDRPGYGVSTLDPDLELSDWPEDVLALADHLGVDGFAVGGHSGGGAFALACGVGIPDRLTATVLVSGVAPFGVPEVLTGMSEGDRAVGRLVEEDPAGLRAFAEEAFGSVSEDPEGFFERLVEGSSPPDRRVLERPPVREMMVANLAEAFSQGPEVWAHESELLFGPWGFDVADVGVHVDLWQGEADDHVPPSMGRYLAENLPDCTARFVEGEGHTVFVTEWDEIVATVAAAAD